MADFIGQANVLPGTVRAADGEGLLVTLTGGADVRARAVPGVTVAQGTEVNVIARPEIIRVGQPAEADLTGRIASLTFVGDKLDYEVRLAKGGLIHAEVQFHHGAAVFAEGDEVGVRFEGRDAVALTK